MTGSLSAYPPAAHERAPRRHAAADLVLFGEGDSTLLDERRLGGGSSHVERDEIVESGARRKVLSADDPRGRTAFDDAGRILRDRIGVEDAAARLHHHQPAADAGVANLGDHGTHVVLHGRSDVGVDGGGGGALVLELLRQHVHGERNERAGQHLAQHLAGAPLMVGVGVGVQIADRDRLDARAADALRRGPHVCFVEGAQLLAARSGPLVDLEAKLPRHERRRALVERLVEVRHPHPPQLQHVAESSGGEQRGRRALAFEDRVWSRRCTRAAALPARRAGIRALRAGRVPRR